MQKWRWISMLSRKGKGVDFQNSALKLSALLPAKSISNFSLCAEMIDEKSWKEGQSDEISRAAFTGV